MADFPSVVEAVQCAVEAQRELAARIVADDPARVMRFRIGRHLGDVMVDGGDLFGEGVNLAARLQALADPGGILISEPVYQQVRGKVPIGSPITASAGRRTSPRTCRSMASCSTMPGPAPLRGSPGGARERPPTRRKRPLPPSGGAPLPPASGGSGIRRRASQYAVILLGLAVIDLSTGGDLWVQ